MTEVRIRSYEALEKYLREFTTWHGDQMTYDFGGAFNLWRALALNLKANGLDQDVVDYAMTLSDDEIAFLKKIIGEAADVDSTNETGV